MSSRFKKLAVIAAVAVALVVGGAATAQARGNAFVSSLAVDVTEDPSQFVITGTNVFPEGHELAGAPAYGESFVTQGYIYPAGTLVENDPGVTCQVDAEGFFISCDPLYEPIGEWTSYGVHIGNGAATTEEYWMVTTQIFDFFSDGQSHTIVTDGFESPVIGGTVVRAITGGTGEFSGARGEQEVVGFGLHPELINMRSTNVFNLLD